MKAFTVRLVCLLEFDVIVPSNLSVLNGFFRLMFASARIRFERCAVSASVGIRFGRYAVSALAGIRFRQYVMFASVGIQFRQYPVSAVVLPLKLGKSGIINLRSVMMC